MGTHLAGTNERWCRNRMGLRDSPLRFEDYRPDLPWVMKVRLDSHLACEVFVYVDDGRITGFCREICWAAARRMASV